MRNNKFKVGDIIISPTAETSEPIKVSELTEKGYTVVDLDLDYQHNSYVPYYNEDKFHKIKDYIIIVECERSVSILKEAHEARTNN